MGVHLQPLSVLVLWYSMYPHSELHQIWSIDHCHYAQRNYGAYDDDCNNSFIHYVSPDVIPLYKYASAL